MDVIIPVMKEKNCPNVRIFK